MISPIAQFVLNQYALGKINSVQALGNAGGFSGAQLWKVASDRGEYCLRRWPLNLQVDVRAIHAVLAIANRHAVPIAAPILDKTDQSLVVTQGNVCWELAPWLPGEADFNLRPSLTKLHEAVSAVANFHKSTSDPAWIGSSLGLNYRLEYLQQAPKLISELLPKIQASTHGFQSMAVHAFPKIAERVAPVQSCLNSFREKPWPLVNAICDIHHDHLLFDGESLSGIVDFGALKRDSPCLDLARMISSLNLDGGSPWQEAFDIYAEIREFSPKERELARAISECNDLLGFLNWMKWIFADQRDFEDWVAVERRINQLFERFAG